MNWRVGLIDSCGTWSGAVEAAAFVSDGSHVERVSPASDPTGHGSRIAALLTEDGARVELLLAQVFLTAQPASAAVVAAAVDWTVSRGAKLIHLSLGLATDRAVLRAAVARAMDSGIVTVAAMPARGAPVYPAAYPSVIGGTGDARCGPGEISVLGPRLFGGCAATAPGRRGGVRRIDGALDVLGLGAGNLANHLARGRRYVVEIPTLGRGDPLAADEILVFGPERNLSLQGFNVRCKRATFDDGIGRRSRAFDGADLGGTHDPSPILG